MPFFREVRNNKFAKIKIIFPIFNDFLAVTDEYLRFKSEYGRVSGLETRKFFVGPDIAEEFDVELAPGKIVTVKPLAVTDLNATGEREVFFNYNGALRSLMVKDKEAAKTLVLHPKASPGVVGSLGAPMPGEVIKLLVKTGQKVKQGETIAVLR